MIEDAWINIDFSIFQNQFVFKIENGKGPKMNSLMSSGIGLHNVMRRLELIYQKRPIPFRSSIAQSFFGDPEDCVGKR